LAHLLHLQGQTPKALDTVKLLFKETPRFAGLGAPLLAQFAKELHQTGEARLILSESYQNKPRLDVLEALIELSPKDEDYTLPSGELGKTGQSNSPMNPVVQNLYAQHLVRTPSLIAATRWLSAETLSNAATQTTVLQTLNKAATPLKRYRCAACGFEALTHFWQCPGCQSWDSYPPERIEEL